MPDLEIILRTCILRDAHPQSRYIEAPKEELTLRCLNSLIHSCQLAQNRLGLSFRLTLVDDHSNASAQSKMKQQLTQSPFSTEWVTVHGSGNGDSLRTCYEIARSYSSKNTYFVEDDYLHQESCILEMMQTLPLLQEKTQSDCVLHPYDCPDRYMTGYVYPSMIAYGSHRHWRTIRDTSATILVSHSVLNRFWNLFMSFTLLDKLPQHYEADTINHIYREIPCFSPIPTLTFHVGGPSTQVPFNPWQPHWEKTHL